MMRYIPWWAYVFLAGLIIGFAIFYSVPAGANPGIESKVIKYALSAAPAICSTLDDHPTLTGLEGVLNAVQNDSGFTDFQTGQAVGVAVKTMCPRHIPLLNRFVDTYASPKATGVTA